MDKRTGTAGVRGYRPALGLLLLLTGAVSAADAQVVQTPASEEQRRRSQTEALERQRRLQAPHAVLPTEAPLDAISELTVPSESPCTTFHRFVLEVPPHLSPAHQLAGASALPFDPFRFAQEYLQQYAGVCVGLEGMDLILQRLEELSKHKGYITTRVGIPKQDLTSGTLKLALIPGVIRAMRFTDPTLYGGWSNAFPTGPGRLLKRDELEQGLEQMRRIPSQTVELHLVSAETLGDNDVVLSVNRSKPWKVSANLDDSGAKGTGKLQAGLHLAIITPLSPAASRRIWKPRSADYFSATHRKRIAGNSRSASAGARPMSTLPKSTSKGAIRRLSNWAGRISIMSVTPSSI